MIRALRPGGLREGRGRAARRAGAAPMLSLVLLLVTAGVPVAGPTTLGVMTFNIRTANTNDGDNAWLQRRDLVADTIERFAPDIAGLQEVIHEQIEYLAASLPDYRWLGVDRGLNGGEGLSEYTPIFYRHAELSPIESGTFWLSATPDGPTGTGWRRRVSRIVTWARFYHRGSGRLVFVFNTHLTLRRGPRQVESVRMITARVAALPPGSAVIVTGDFNAVAEASDTWRAATGEGLRDAWIVADERRGPPRTSSDFLPPAEANEGRIDWILVGGPLGVRSVETILHNAAGRYPSDHYPVIARVEIRE